MRPTPLLARRRCVWTVGLFGMAATLGAAPAPNAPADVVIVGAGIAGLSAAWEAAQAGSRVTVVDMWSIFGGHAVMSHGGVCIVGTPDQEARAIRDTPELAYKDFVDWGEDPRPEWVRYYVETSRREIYDWLTAMGVTFEGVTPVPGNSVPRFHETRGRGLHLVSPIYRACLAQPRVEFRFNLEVTGLFVEGGRVAGVRGRDMRTGETQTLRASALILATGGFQSNLEMVRAFWPAPAPFPPRMLIGSGVNSVGSGHEIARKAGAVLESMDHQWNYATGLPDPRDPTQRRGLNASNAASIWLNAEGRRFVDESLSDRFRLPALLTQAGASYWAIFDEPKKREFWVSGSDWGDFATIERLIFGDPKLVKQAPTLDALAERTGLPKAVLVATLARYNEIVASGEDADFGRFGAGRGERPLPIDTPPYYAVQFFPLSRKSMGGVRIDLHGRVVDKDGTPIAGLYAAGELTGLAGINGKAGLEGTFLGPSIVTGRVAGRTAVADLREAGWQPAAADRGPSPTRAAVPASAEYRPTVYCQSCHNLEAALAGPPRRGYSHFEKVHRIVLERRSDCASCHAEIGRYRPGAHVIDRVAQIETCRSCHLAVER